MKWEGDWNGFWVLETCLLEHCLNLGFALDISWHYVIGIVLNSFNVVMTLKLNIIIVLHRITLLVTVYCRTLLALYLRMDYFLFWYVFCFALIEQQMNLVKRGCFWIWWWFIWNHLWDKSIADEAHMVGQKRVRSELTMLVPELWVDITFPEGHWWTRWLLK